MSVLVSIIALIIAIIGLTGNLVNFGACNSQALLTLVIALWMDPGKLQTTTDINEKRKRKTVLHAGITDSESIV